MPASIKDMYFLMEKVIARARHCFMITFVERETTRGDTSQIGSARYNDK